MLVDREGVAGPGHLAGCGLGGAGLAEVAPPHVLVQVRVLRLLHDLLGGLPDDGRSRGLRERRRELGDVVLGSHVERVERGRQIHRLRAHAREEVSRSANRSQTLSIRKSWGSKPPSNTSST